MTRARRTIKKWGYTIVLGALTVGIVVEAIFLVPVIGKQASYAEDGRLARERQIRVKPVTCKEHIDAFHRGVITLDDLALVGCPPRG